MSRILEGRDGPAWLTEGFVVAMFKGALDNTDPDKLVDLAVYLVHRIGPTEEHRIGFEFVVEPLQSFFGRQDCFALMMKPLGYGGTEDQAWKALDHAAAAISPRAGRWATSSAGLRRLELTGRSHDRAHRCLVSRLFPHSAADRS